MSKEKFLRVDERPLNVFPGLALVGAFGDVSQGQLAFSIVGQSGQCRHVEIIQYDSLAGLLGQQFANVIARIPKFLIDCGAVNELQCLGKVAVLLTLALAGQFPARLAEGFQERMIHFTIGKLHGPRPERHVGKFLGHLRDRADGVEQLLGRQEPGHRV